VGDGTGGDSEGRTRRLVAICAALFVLSVGLAVLAAVLASKLESERSRHHDVEEVAGRFATALLTYDHEHLDDAKRRVLALSTGKFRREYEQAFTAGLDVLIRETKATSSGTVTDVFVGGVEQDTASAIVVANAVSEGTAGTRRSVASYIQLELVRVSGAWRVDGVTNLNFGQNSEAEGLPAAPTTTTSAPPG
jgi:Mce-associated membrane protein